MEKLLWKERFKDQEQKSNFLFSLFLEGVIRCQKSHDNKHITIVA